MKTPRQAGGCRQGGGGSEEEIAAIVKDAYDPKTQSLDLLKLIPLLRPEWVKECIESGLEEARMTR